uniref:Uncharacterized protein n=1 Tax=Lygus hesperus TaxID=30085 RepID=A0A0A9YEH7_LYGHE
MSRKSLKIVHEPFRRSSRIRDRLASAARIETINLVSDEDEDVRRVTVPMPKVVSSISNVRRRRSGIKREKVEDSSVREPEESRAELEANGNSMECEEERGSDERGESDNSG